MLGAIAMFVIGSIACALAPSMMALIVARGVQGLGGGGLIALAQTIIADIVSPRERGRYQGYIGAVFALSSVGGPVLGGFLTEHLDWSLIFWINLPLGAAALAMCWRVLKLVPFHKRDHQLDIIGAVLMMLASVALLLALSWGGRLYPWLSGAIVGLFVLSALLWAAFAWRLRTAAEPFLPLAVLGNKVVGAAALAGACNMATLIGMTIFVPLYFEVVVHLSATQSGLGLIPMMTAVVVAATLTGRKLSSSKSASQSAQRAAASRRRASSRTVSTWPSVSSQITVRSARRPASGPSLPWSCSSSIISPLRRSFSRPPAWRTATSA